MLSKTQMILDSLENVEEREFYYLADCPVNENHSVMVRDSETREGKQKALIHCKHCNQNQILDALGLAWFELYETYYDLNDNKIWLQKYLARRKTNIKPHTLELKEANRLLTRIELYG